mmetsp:Transcript_3806/g.7058  ORF Transcript_3806/g.7058 Transcript_3806/m.7058 type:complete len:188 (-) Transcript_3806:188-751(-)
MEPTTRHHLRRPPPHRQNDKGIHGDDADHKTGVSQDLQSRVIYVSELLPAAHLPPCNAGDVLQKQGGINGIVRCATDPIEVPAHHPSGLPEALLHPGHARRGVSKGGARLSCDSCLGECPDKGEEEEGEDVVEVAGGADGELDAARGEGWGSVGVVQVEHFGGEGGVGSAEWAEEWAQRAPPSSLAL